MAKDDPMNLDEPGEWSGLWWLPDDPDHQVPGILRYSPDDGLVLSLIGAFEDRITSTPSPGQRSSDSLNSLRSSVSQTSPG